MLTVRKLLRAMLHQGETLSGEALDHSELGPLLARIGASKHFRRSLRLRTFLEYACEETFAGRANLINEQTVGHHVFGRPRAYDPSSDNIVRVEARELRKRLDAYYGEEGAEDPVLIRMPKGGYAVTFEPRAVPASPFSTELVAAPAPTGGSGQRLLIIGLAATVVLLGFVSFYFYRRSVAQSERSVASSSKTPLASAFWAKLFDPKRPTLMSLPDSNLALLQDLRTESIAAA